MRLPAAFLVLAALTTFAAPASAQAPLALDVGDGAPRLAVGPVLDELALQEAVRSGLPLRLRFRVELWRDALFDDLVDQTEWTVAVAYEPLARQYLTATVGEDSVARHDRYAAAREAVEGVYRTALGPVEPGRYYYLAFLEIETLSLSDLDELERWLRGDLEPAVRGGGSLTGAIGTGLKRLLVRLLGLPARRYETRSEAVRLP